MRIRLWASTNRPTTQRGVQPQRKQHSRVYRRTSGLAASGLDRSQQPAQTLLLDIAPHQPGTMILGQQRLQVRRAQLNLLAVGLAQPRSALLNLARHRCSRRLYLRRTGRLQVLEQARLGTLGVWLIEFGHAKNVAAGERQRASQCEMRLGGIVLRRQRSPTKVRDTFNLEAAVDRAQMGCDGVRWQGATTTWA